MKKAYVYSCLVLLLGAWGMFSSCNHDTDEDGPSLVDRFGPFRLEDSLSVSAPTVDFANGETVFFTAAFNKNVNWTVTITGQESGSVKEITGFSRELNPETATWDGTTTELPLFRAEPCTAVLTVEGEDSLQLTTQLEVLSGRVYEGSLITDFEAAGPNIVQRNFEFEFTARVGVTQEIPAGSGESCLLLEGTDREDGGATDNFFVGLFEILAPVTGEQFIPVPSTVPEDVVFNCFIYGNGDPATIAIVDFYADGNGNGTYEEGPDTQFTTGNINVTWTGWQLFSITMSDLGITEQQLQELVGMRLVLISDNNNQTMPRGKVSYGVDFMIFTQNQPLMP
ncbi:MAG: hypothetical protein AAGI38_03070 [Bacteroidota bacterium]